MWNFIKGLFKFLFVSTLVITGVVGVGLAVLTYVFKKTLKKSKAKRKKLLLISKRTKVKSNIRF